MKAKKSIECSEVLHRLVTNSNKIQNGKALPEAFFRKQNKDGSFEKGLSVNLSSLRTIEESINPEKSLKGVKLISSLHSGKVKDIDNSLEIVHSPTADNPSHAEILGLPLRRSTDTAKAEYLAGLLAEHARTVWKKSGIP